MPGYHVKDIERGVFGEASKIREELEEFLDALDQNCKLMALIELSDLIGAIKGYLEKHAPGWTLSELDIMSEITKRAFKNGYRD
jgi:hypothetical protein